MQSVLYIMSFYITCITLNKFRSLLRLCVPHRECHMMSLVLSGRTYISLLFSRLSYWVTFFLCDTNLRNFESKTRTLEFLVRLLTPQIIAITHYHTLSHLTGYVPNLRFQNLYSILWTHHHIIGLSVPFKKFFSHGSLVGMEINNERTFFGLSF